MVSLFSPLHIKDLTIQNRLVMPPMALDIASERGEVTSPLMEHYLLRAGSSSGENAAEGERASLGLIIVEHSYIHPDGRAHPHQLGIYDHSLIPGLRVLVDEIHRQGIPAGIQLSHAGARALTSPSAPSRTHCSFLRRYGHEENGRAELPHELSKTEIIKIREAFRTAAGRAKKAGFDMVEIHGAHGYLLNQFYSPLTNHRSDEYGGSFKKRLQFPLEVIQAVREAVGSEMPIFYRLGADDRLPEGNTADDSKSAVPFLVEAGVDCLDLSGGLGGYIKNGPEGFFEYLGKEIKPIAPIPIMITGGIKNPKTAEALIAENKADLVGIGRALLADPEWAVKAWETIKPKIES
jgi:2,4-dienoyl-CoA reductase-like NADH-dependent reductase (Old Yellow Enzyme family)